MAGIPKVKIQFDADLDGLKKGTASADKEVGGFADRVGEFGKKAAAAFAVAAAAAAAYAVKLAVDGVKAAIEDEQAQIKLASALEKATGATNAQIKAVEDQILKTSLATGVADDKLRPALQRLAVATGNTEQAQKLLNLALDISAATGKPLETVSNALGKAYEGNTTALAKLNAGISTADAKTLGYTGAVQKLTDLYGGAAAANADTYQGRIDRLKIAFDETKETIGAALLPILDKLLSFVTDNILPIFDKFSQSLNGQNGIVQNFKAVVNFVKDFFEPIIESAKDAFEKLAATFNSKKDDFNGILDTFKEIFAWVNKYLIPLFQTYLVGAIELAVLQIKTAINVLVPVIKFILETVKMAINGFIDVINLAIKGYNTFARLTGKQQVQEIQKIGEMTKTGALGNFQMSTGTTLTSVADLTPSQKKALDAFIAGGGKGTVIDPTGQGLDLAGIGKNIIDSNKAYQNQAKVTAVTVDTLTDAFGNLAKTIELKDSTQKLLENLSPEIAQRTALGLPPLGGTIPANFDVAAARRGEERGNTYNVTVNGAMDSESTARQIVTLLNDSQARGTLGASGFAGLINQ